MSDEPTVEWPTKTLVEISELANLNRYATELDTISAMLQVIYPKRDIRGVGRLECVAALTMFLQDVLDCNGNLNEHELLCCRKAIKIAEKATDDLCD